LAAIQAYLTSHKAVDIGVSQARCAALAYSIPCSRALHPPSPPCLPALCSCSQFRATLDVALASAQLTATFGMLLMMHWPQLNTALCPHCAPAVRFRLLLMSRWPQHTHAYAAWLQATAHAKLQWMHRPCHHILQILACICHMGACMSHTHTHTWGACRPEQWWSQQGHCWWRCLWQWSCLGALGVWLLPACSRVCVCVCACVCARVCCCARGLAAACTVPVPCRSTLLPQFMMQQGDQAYVF